MSSEYPEILRGIGIPARRVNADTISDDSTATQAAPEAGTPTTTSDLRIDATGAPTGSLSVRAQSSGLAGRAGASFAVRSGTDDWFGWDLPVGIRNREVLANISGTTAPTDHTACIASPDGALLVAEARYSSGINTIRVHRQEPGAGWATTTAALATSESSFIAAPALCALPSGRVLLFVVVYDTANNLAQVRQLYSDNDGVSFSVGANYVLPESIDSSTVTINRMAVAESAGQVSLVLSVTDDGKVKPYQYASNDLGSSFTLVFDDVATFVSDVGTKHWDVVGLSVGGFMLAALYTSSTDGTGSVLTLSLVIPSAFTPINDGTFTAGTSAGILISGTYQQWPALCVDDTGSIWLHVIGKGAGAGQATVTYDNGTSWNPIGSTESSSTAGQWWDTGTLEAGPWGMSSAYLNGSVYVAHYTTEVSSVEGGRSPAVLQLGGYTSVTLPAVDQFVSKTNGLAYSLTYAGMSSPTDYGLSLAGTATESLDGDGWLTVESSGALIAYTDATATDHAVGQIHHIVCEPVIGGMFIQSVVSDGTDSWGVEITWDGGIIMKDLSGDNAQSLPSPEYFAIKAAAEFLIAVSTTGYTVGIRPAGNAEVPFYTIQNPITPVLGAVSERFRWGTVPDGNPPNRFKTISYARAVSSDFAENIANDFTSPDDLRGFPLTTAPRYVLDGVSLAAVGGPALVDQTWSIPVRYAYPLANIHSDSPQNGWRSEDATADQSIIWDLEDLDDGVDVSTNGLAYLYLDRVNFKECILEHTDGLGSSYSVTMADIDLSTSFAFTRTGHQVQAATSGTDVAGPYFEPDALVGSQIEFASGEVVPIAGNTGGYLSSGATAEFRCLIFVEQDTIDNTTSGIGTATIWHNRAIVYMHAAKNPAAKMRLRIHHNGPADPYTGDFRIGTLDYGSVRVFSRAYGWNRRIGYRSNVEVTTLPNGSTRAQRKGERVPSVQLKWNEGLITDQDCAVPVYSSTGTNVPVSSSRDTAYVVSSLPDAGDVVTYHANIPEGPDVTVILSPSHRRVMRLRLSDPTWEVITGTEGVDEFVRIEIDGEGVV